ncbi:hypothetical protein [Streptomyces sp. NPDC093514]|uniref:hypothetical protein n=1 Tax=Streptomyces sp. NPDC093514 TaxID=3366039 RepID=UPI00382CF0D9
MYTEYLQRRNEVVRAALRDWGVVKVPSQLQDDVSAAFWAADSAARNQEIAARWGALGNEDKANHYLDEAGRYATEANGKARAAGLQVCPLGL